MCTHIVIHQLMMPCAYCARATFVDHITARSSEVSFVWIQTSLSCCWIHSPPLSKASNILTAWIFQNLIIKSDIRLNLFPSRSWIASAALTPPFWPAGGLSMTISYCGLNADSCLQNIDQMSNYLQVMSTPRKELPRVELNEASWSRMAAPNTKKIKYMEGLQINIAKFYMAFYVLFTYKPNMHE